MYLINKFSIFVLALACLLAVSDVVATEVNMPNEDINVVLIGASIGNGWKFNELPDRLGLDGFKLEFVPVFDAFDKSPAIDDIINRSELPDVVIIKECSVYFPGNMADYQDKIRQWAEQLAEKNIDVIFATSVPVSERTGLVSKVKGLIKGVMGKPDKMKQLTAYNDWLRDVASQRDIDVLDLEAVLRVSDEVRYMDPKYDRGDHVHLNSDAYKTLDQVGKDLLLKIKAEHSDS